MARRLQGARLIARFSFHSSCRLLQATPLRQSALTMNSVTESQPEVAAGGGDEANTRLWAEFQRRRKADRQQRCPTRQANEVHRLLAQVQRERREGSGVANVRTEPAVTVAGEAANLKHEASEVQQILHSVREERCNAANAVDTKVAPDAAVALSESNGSPVEKFAVDAPGVIGEDAGPPQLPKALQRMYASKDGAIGIGIGGARGFCEGRRAASSGRCTGKKQACCRRSSSTCSLSSTFGSRVAARAQRRVPGATDGDFDAKHKSPVAGPSPRSSSPETLSGTFGSRVAARALRRMPGTSEADFDAKLDLPAAGPRPRSNSPERLSGTIGSRVAARAQRRQPCVDSYPSGGWDDRTTCASTFTAFPGSILRPPTWEELARHRPRSSSPPKRREAVSDKPAWDNLTSAPRCFDGFPGCKAREDAKKTKQK